MKHSFQPLVSTKIGYAILAYESNAYRMGPRYLMLEPIFDSAESVKNYAADRLNESVTVVAAIVPVPVPADADLLHWGDR